MTKTATKSDTKFDYEAASVAAGMPPSDLASEAATGLAVQSDLPTYRGVSVVRVMVMKQFASPDWIMQNCCVKGAGTRVSVARIIGYVTGYEHKTVTWQDKVLKSIVLSGKFEGTSLSDGTVSEHTAAYLPMAFAEQIAATMAADETINIVEIDLDIGVRATGKTIPYEWTCVSFREDGKHDVLARLRNRRTPQTSSLALIQGDVPKQIANA